MYYKVLFVSSWTCVDCSGVTGCTGPSGTVVCDVGSCVCFFFLLIITDKYINPPITTNNIEDARYKRYSNILKINKNKDIEDKVIKDIYKYYKKGNKKIDKYIDDLSIYVEYNTDLPEYK